ncbi:hypothetical protein PCG10_009950 [Penicillium crustosum]|uniref:Uncharacterized protein n=1 Tax=Penicillium crustosum TaxID=36656 RepID=A0A9P5GI40_PENCR|nr:hypothetical protein PCG10_009950 [Penicillium crustosum]
MPNNNPACADCKAKKKRCIHRNQPVKVTEAEAVTASMSSPSGPPPPPVPTPAATPAPVAPPGVATRGRRKAAEAKAKAKEMSPVPADSSDELSSLPSEAEEKPVVKKPTKRTRRANTTAAPESQTGPRDLSPDNLHASSTMSVHAIWARTLQDNLQRLERSMQAFNEAHRNGLAAPQALNEAHRETLAAAQAIQHTVDGWIQTWAVSGR